MRALHKRGRARLASIGLVACVGLAFNATPTTALTSRTASPTPYSGGPYWAGWDIARGVVLLHSGAGGAGYVVDGWGGLHPFGGAPALGGTRYWPGVDWVRGAAVGRRSDTNTTGDQGGTLTDAAGKLFDFGPGPSPVAGDTGWSRFLPARGISFYYDQPATPGVVSGAHVDAWGGIHQFVGSGGLKTDGAPYWRGWDIVRGIAFATDGSGGFILDGYGGIHPFGFARLISSSGYWPGWDIARGIAVDGTTTHGVVVDAWGGLHPFTYQ
jgi:hypothetical protein